MPAPSSGEMTKRQLYALVAKLKGAADDKDQCGLRLGRWYEDVARGFAGGKSAQGAKK